MKTQFKSATDFRRSIEAKLANIAKQSGQDLQRLRRKLAFDRLLTRIFKNQRHCFLLKGGYAMELRFAQARATKDIDLTCLEGFQNRPEINVAKEIQEELVNLCNIDLGDYFVFRIGEAQIDLDNAPYGGARYPVSTYVDDRLFVSFKIDIGLDVCVDQIEVVKGYDWLEYCNIASSSFQMITVEQQFAEKIHAYSMPRERPNSRVKDLIDLLLLINMINFNKNRCTTALKAIFKVRRTHTLPVQLVKPPLEWESLFKKMALECGLEPNIQTAFDVVANYYGALNRD